MISRKDVMPVNYYRKEPFTGSDRGMRYMLRKKDQEDGSARLEAIIWPQPFCFEKTADEKKTDNTFSFDEAGIEAAIEWMNKMYEERKEEFLEAQRASGL